MSIAPNLRTVHDDVLKQAVIGSGVQGITPYSAIGELSRRINEANRLKQMQGQMAQQQNQPQPPIAQQVVAEADMDRGIGGLPVGGQYAAGGVVAFSGGNTVKSGSPQPLQYSTDTGMYDPGMPSPYASDSTWQRYRFRQEAAKQGKRVMLTPEEEFALSDPTGIIGRIPAERPVDLAKQGFEFRPGVGLVKDGKPVAGTAPQSEAPAAPAARPRPPAPVAQPAAPFALTPTEYKYSDSTEASPFPAGAGQSDLEAQLQRDVAAQQDLMREQKGVAPEVLAARKRAEDIAQASITRREADRAKMEGEMKARSGRDWTQNTELIGSMLGGLQGAKTLGQALSGAGAAMGATTTAQRKEQMEQQALMRIEANAIDTLKQAQADKQVAIATGDTDKAQAADKAIADASTALTKARQEMRDNIAHAEYEKVHGAASTVTAQAAKDRVALEAKEHPLDRASRERIAASGLAAAQANRDEMMGFRERQLGEQQYKNSAEYRSIQKKIEAADKLYGYAKTPETKRLLDAARAEEAALRAKFTGEPTGAPAPGAGATTAGWR